MIQSTPPSPMLLPQQSTGPQFLRRGLQWVGGPSHPPGNLYAAGMGGFDCLNSRVLSHGVLATWRDQVGQGSGRARRQRGLQTTKETGPSREVGRKPTAVEDSLQRESRSWTCREA